MSQAALKQPEAYDIRPIADKFENGTFVKPIVKETEFFVGGFYAMLKRLRVALRPFRGAWEEYEKRTQDMVMVGAIGTMWEYVQLELEH